MTDHVHRDDFDLVGLVEQDELTTEASEQATAVSNAEAERAARAKRELEPVAVASAPQREFVADPGDVETSSASAGAARPVDDAAADAIARWSAIGGPPAPRAPDCTLDASWIGGANAGHASLRDGEDWIADYGAAPSTLTDGPSGWLPDVTRSL